MTRSEPGDGRRVILLVDDEPGITTAMTLLLELEGYVVLLAANGRQALAELRRTRPDLVVTDVMMPGMDGHALTRAIRSDPALRDLPVLMMSAGMRPDDRELALADAFLPKGGATDELLMVIDQLSDRPRGGRVVPYPRG